MYYELLTLEMRLWGNINALDGIAQRFAEDKSGGTLLGCWDIDIGLLGRLILLRSFDARADLDRARETTMLASDPFGAGQHMRGFTAEAYQLFPSMAPYQAGKHGNFYEFRDYQLEPGSLPDVMHAWEKALPARQGAAPVLAAMYGLDGRTRMLHIAPFDSYQERLNTRRSLFQSGQWPPKGAPDRIVEARSTIAIPNRISPST